MEPVQEFVKLCLEREGYFIQSDVRYVVPTPAGKTSSYSDLDLLGIRINSADGTINNRLWGEVKAHLTLSLTPSYIKRFAKQYGTMLDLSNPELGFNEDEKLKAQIRQDAAAAKAREVLGANYRRVLFFAGRRPTELALAAVRKFFLSNMEIQLVEKMVPRFLKQLSTQEDNEPIVRVLNMLRSFGHLSKDIVG